MNITYQKASQRDIPLIIDIAEKTWFSTYYPIIGKEQTDFMFDLIYSAESLNKQMLDGQKFIIQYVDNQVSAYASFSWKDEANKVIKLNKLYLITDFQKLGLGKKMISEVEKQIKTLGAEILDLNVNKYNPAKMFYEACGFKVLLEEDIPIGNYWMNDYVMRKVIDIECA